MNDRYLFKAKRIDNGEWVVGNLVYSEDTDKEFRTIIIPTKESYMYTDGEDKDLGFENWYKVDSSTLCQCTGLKDKNGTLIWENDVVCTPYVDPIFGDMVNDNILEDYTWKVLFIDGVFCVDNGYNKIYLKSFCKNECVKVLSNIFDNPELLEVGE